MSEAVVTPVGIHKRVFAAFVDCLLASVVCAVAELVGVVGFANSLLWSVLFMFRDAAGASLGKRWAKLSIAAMDGGQPAVGKLILRNLVIALPFGALIEYIAIRRSKDGRRIGDTMAATRVIDQAPERPDEPYLWYGLALVLVLILLTALPYYLDIVAVAKAAK